MQLTGILEDVLQAVVPDRYERLGFGQPQAAIILHPRFVQLPHEDDLLLAAAGEAGAEGLIGPQVDPVGGIPHVDAGVVGLGEDAVAAAALLHPDQRHALGLVLEACQNGAVVDAVIAGVHQLVVLDDEERPVLEGNVGAEVRRQQRRPEAVGLDAGLQVPIRGHPVLGQVRLLGGAVDLEGPSRLVHHRQALVLGGGERLVELAAFRYGHVPGGGRHRNRTQDEQERPDGSTHVGGGFTGQGLTRSPRPIHSTTVAASASAKTR